MEEINELSSAKRLAALDRSGLMDGAAEERFDRLTRTVARALGVPVSLVSLVDSERQFFKSQIGLPSPWAEWRQTPLSHSFCQHVVVGRKPLRIDDATGDPLVCDNLAIRDLQVRAYLGVPLTDPDGHVLGSLCAIDTQPRHWTDEDEALLADMAAIATEALLLEIEVARRERVERHQELLIGELHHRIKNTLATVKAVVSMTIRSAADKQDIQDALGARIDALARSHDIIHRKGDSPIELSELIAANLDAYADPQRTRVAAQTLPISDEAAVQLSLVINELATNAAKYGALRNGSGMLTVEWDNDGDDSDYLRLRWAEEAPDLIAPPQGAGFGSKLITAIVTGYFAGSHSVDYRPDGMEMIMRLQMAQLRDATR